MINFFCSGSGLGFCSGFFLRRKEEYSGFLGWFFLPDNGRMCKMKQNDRKSFREKSFGREPKNKTKQTKIYDDNDNDDEGKNVTITIQP